MDQARLRELVRNFPENGMKLLLESPANVRDLLNLSDREVVKRIDLEKLRLVRHTFVQPDYRHLEADVVLQAPLLSEARETLWIYILIEHQFQKDRLMPLRLLQYLVAIFSLQERKWRERRGFHRLVLQPVLPVVFHTGAAQWDDVGSLADLLEPGDLFRAETPSFTPLFLSLPAIGTSALETEGGYLGWVLRLVQERNVKPVRFRRLVARVVRHLETMPAAERMRWLRLLSYIHALVYHVREPTEQAELRREIEASVATDSNRQEVTRMGKTIAEDLIEQGIAKGMAKGQLQTACGTLIRLLRRRFGELPEDTVAIVEATADLDQLNAWLDLVVTAGTLEDVGIRR